MKCCQRFKEVIFTYHPAKNQKYHTAYLSVVKSRNRSLVVIITISGNIYNSLGNICKILSALLAILYIFISKKLYNQFTSMNKSSDSVLKTLTTSIGG
jgi:heme O synthase-like polyprenyltransferase